MVMNKTARAIIEAAIAQQAAHLADLDWRNGSEHYVWYTPELVAGVIEIPGPPTGSGWSFNYCWGKVTCHRDGSISIRWCSHDDGPWPAVRIQNPTVEAVLHEIRDVQLPDGV
jgi:hypothetical protein